MKEKKRCSAGFKSPEIQYTISIMARSFVVPAFYKAEQLTQLKTARHAADPKRKDTRPSSVDCGPVRFQLARHFGFCFGVENAIEIAYRAISENVGKRIFLLSEIIHNPEVNEDLLARGARFLMTPRGEHLIPFEELTAEDIVVVPAFGTTLEIQKKLQERGIDPYYFDSTCPFVQKVWKRALELGSEQFTVIVHGKRAHEETRATFSHSKENAPTLVVLNREEAELVCDFMRGNVNEAVLRERLSEGMSDDFDPSNHLQRIGVVNQTTMLASETLEIAELFRDTMRQLYGEEKLAEHFADTRDTLCYATYENQGATLALVETGADLAIVVGGYNSSNTSHLVELTEKAMPTFYIRNSGEILSAQSIRHFDMHSGSMLETANWLPEKRPFTVAITAGASCPDRIVEEVMKKISELCGGTFPTQLS